LKVLPMKRFILTVLILLGSQSLSRADYPSENEWAAANAERYNADDQSGLWDGTECDYITSTEAIEIDWAKKWAEAIGQSLYYSILLNKRPAIILLVKKGVGPRLAALQKGYVYRCQTVCAKLDIKLYVEKVKPE